MIIYREKNASTVISKYVYLFCILIYKVIYYNGHIYRKYGSSHYISIFVRILTGILPLPALFLKTSDENLVVKDVLKVETIVQFVEGLFYILVVYLTISVFISKISLF